MRRRISILAAAAILSATLAGNASAAWRDYHDTDSHPLRLAAYAVHPAGFAIEWAVMRPLIWMLSLPGMRQVFGYDKFHPERDAPEIGHVK